MTFPIAPSLGALALGAVTLFALPAAASPQGGSDCGAPDRQRTIAGCTRIIDDPHSSANERVHALGARALARIQVDDRRGALVDLTAVLAARPQDPFIR